MTTLATLPDKACSAHSKWLSHHLDHNLHRHVTLTLEESNPELDTMATWEHTLQYQFVRQELPPQQPTNKKTSTPTRDRGEGCMLSHTHRCHTPTGCVGHMALDRLEWLHNKYKETKCLRPEVFKNQLPVIPRRDCRAPSTVHRRSITFPLQNQFFFATSHSQRYHDKPPHRLWD